MVDFEKLNRDRYASLDDAGRARVDAYWARERASEDTVTIVDGHFERLDARPVAAQPAFTLAIGNLRQKKVGGNPATWTKPVTIRIETRSADDDTEILAFLGAVTGHERYTLDEDFCRYIVEGSATVDSERFYVCAGTTGRYDACWIERSDIERYLRDRRPDLVERATGSSARL